jgi:NHL repeat
MMMHTMRLMLLAIAMSAACVAIAQAQVRVETLSGTGEAGLADGNRQVGQLTAGPAAKFNRPIDIVLTPDGALAVSEENNHRLRKIILR